MFIESLEDRQLFSAPAAPSPVPIPYPLSTVDVVAHQAESSVGGSGSLGLSGFGSSATLMTATSNQR